MLQALAQGETLTLIDIRSRGDYGRRHIPGAISIPAALIEHKRLPPLGRVVVYGDGIDAAQARAAVAVLDARPGIDAELLEGGLGAWDTQHLPSTGGRGLRREPIPGSELMEEVPPPVRLGFYDEDSIFDLAEPADLLSRGKFLRDPDGRVQHLHFHGRQVPRFEGGESWKTVLDGGPPT